MIPNKPLNYKPESLENIMFNALERLPDDYYIFYSLRISTVVSNTLYESETDFVIFNRNLGILCIEAKAGQVHYEDGYWFYGSGEIMENGGPFFQASQNKWKLQKYFQKHNLSYVIDRCKFLHAVWFPSINMAQLDNMTLPPEADRLLIMTQESLDNPEQNILRIFTRKVSSRTTTNLSDTDVTRILKQGLCPEFNVFPSVSYEADLKKIVFHRLLTEQSNILNYLSEQKSAAINGAAGTGKTMIAIEKAKRQAYLGEKVLFLCYNNQLKEFLIENYSDENIDYYTISGLACKMCNTQIPDYGRLESILEEMYINDTFPYMHVIIDEGQDFGAETIEETNIIELLEKIVVDTMPDNSNFYIFYDKLQMVQSERIPKYISEADCKLTLYKNCRNSENIAKTSLAPIKERKLKLMDGCVIGKPANIYYCNNSESIEEKLKEVLEKLKRSGINDIVILTCKTENTTSLRSHINNGKYMNEFKFTTCRKFKGLEADSVVLVDVDKDVFVKNSLLYYVGASRARLWLDIIATMNNDDCKTVLEKIFDKNNIRNGQRELAAVINSIPLK